MLSVWEISVNLLRQSLFEKLFSKETLFLKHSGTSEKCNGLKMEKQCNKNSDVYCVYEQLVARILPQKQKSTFLKVFFYSQDSSVFKKFQKTFQPLRHNSKVLYYRDEQGHKKFSIIEKKSQSFIIGILVVLRGIISKKSR